MLKSKSPYKLNEEAIEKLTASGVIRGAVAIHLFFQNARKESLKGGWYERAIVQGLEGYYWLVMPDDADRLIDSGYPRLSPESLLA